MKIEQVVDFFDSVFKDYSIKDFSNNGLQVEASDDIAKIAFAVDACLDTFQKAAAAGAQMLFVHHGISWRGGIPYLSGFMGKRIGALYRAGLSLYAQHIPLDMHAEIGNNAVLANILGLAERLPFGEFCGATIGAAGTLPQPVTIATIARTLENALGATPRLAVDCGKLVRTVGIVSGSGDSALDEAAQKHLDCLVTGEFGHARYQQAMEQGVSVIAAGHYATETTGIRAMMELTRQTLNLPCVFIDSPTGL